MEDIKLKYHNVNKVFKFFLLLPCGIFKFLRVSEDHFIFFVVNRTKKDKNINII